MDKQLTYEFCSKLKNSALKLKNTVTEKECRLKELEEELTSEKADKRKQLDMLQEEVRAADWSISIILTSDWWSLDMKRFERGFNAKSDLLLLSISNIRVFD